MPLRYLTTYEKYLPQYISPDTNQNQLEASWCGFLRRMVKGGFRRRSTEDGSETNFSFVYTNIDILRITKCQPLRDFINRRYLKYIAQHEHVWKLIIYKPRATKSVNILLRYGRVAWYLPVIKLILEPVNTTNAFEFYRENISFFIAHIWDTTILEKIRMRNTRLLKI